MTADDTQSDPSSGADHDLLDAEILKMAARGPDPSARRQVFAEALGVIETLDPGGDARLGQLIEQVRAALTTGYALVEPAMVNLRLLAKALPKIRAHRRAAATVVEPGEIVAPADDQAANDAKVLELTSRRAAREAGTANEEAVVAAALAETAVEVAEVAEEVAKVARGMAEAADDAAEAADDAAEAAAPAHLGIHGATFEEVWSDASAPAPDQLFDRSTDSGEIATDPTEWNALPTHERAARARELVLAPAPPRFLGSIDAEADDASLLCALAGEIEALRQPELSGLVVRLYDLAGRVGSTDPTEVIHDAVERLEAVTGALRRHLNQ